MEWQAAPLFATPVFKIPIPGTEGALSVFETRVKETEIPGIIDQQGVLSHFYSRGNVFDEFAELRDLGQMLIEAGDFVYRELMNYTKSGPLKITNAWFNLCEIGGAQPMHAHVNCLLCGTLYLRADDNTKLYFENPQSIPSHHAEMFDMPDDAANRHGLKFHQQQAQFPVQSGDCLFWPARLRHGYSANKTPGRLSLSFNMMPERLNVDYKFQT